MSGLVGGPNVFGFLWQWLIKSILDTSLVTPNELPNIHTLISLFVCIEVYM